MKTMEQVIERFGNQIEVALNDHSVGLGKSIEMAGGVVSQDYSHQLEEIGSGLNRIADALFALRDAMGAK